MTVADDLWSASLAAARADREAREATYNQSKGVYFHDDEPCEYDEKRVFLGAWGWQPVKGMFNGR